MSDQIISASTYILRHILVYHRLKGSEQHCAGSLLQTLSTHSQWSKEEKQALARFIVKSPLDFGSIRGLVWYDPGLLVGGTIAHWMLNEPAVERKTSEEFC